MTFSVFVPPAGRAGAGAGAVLPQRPHVHGRPRGAVHKGGAFKACAEAGVMTVFPDTSPRRAGVAAEEDGHDLGTGAGFYVDATAAPWSAAYRMYTYVTEELPALVEAGLPSAKGLMSITGHSMGGHGALTSRSRTPSRTPVSARSPHLQPVGGAVGQEGVRRVPGRRRRRGGGGGCLGGARRDGVPEGARGRGTEPVS